MNKIEIFKCRCGTEPKGPTYYSPSDGYQQGDGFYRVECPNCGANVKSHDPWAAVIDWDACVISNDIRSLKLRRKWIDLNEHRPELGEDVLLFDNSTRNQKICIGCLIVEDETCVQLADSGSIIDLNRFSHWMPLPKPPKGE